MYVSCCMAQDVNRDIVQYFHGEGLPPLRLRLPEPPAAFSAITSASMAMDSALRDQKLKAIEGCLQITLSLRPELCTGDLAVFMQSEDLSGQVRRQKNATTTVKETQVSPSALCPASGGVIYGRPRK